MVLDSSKLEAILEAIFADSDFGALEYDEIAGHTERLVDGLAKLLAEAREGGEHEGLRRSEMHRIAGLIQRRKFESFRGQIRARSSLEKFLIEVFLAARIRNYVLAYLSVQEGENFEGGGPYETLIPAMIATTLRDIGKRSNFEIRLNYRLLKLRINLDPTSNLRAIYRNRFERSGEGRSRKLRRWASDAYHRLLFRVKSALAFRAGSALAKDLRKNSDDPIRAVFELKLFEPILRHQLPFLFDETAGFTPAQWDDLSSRIRGYFPDRLRTFFRVTPRHSLESKGLIKLLKVAVGAVAGRNSMRKEHEPDPVNFVFNTLRLAYCWGVTYPLVDNVLDSIETTADDRADLTRSLSHVFKAGPSPDSWEGPGPSSTNPAIVEVEQRLDEALRLIPPPRLERAKSVLRHLCQAHRNDAKRRLDELPDDAEGVALAWRDVLVDTALKSALVRLATMEICAIDVDRATRDRSLSRALYNQLGDDLWDIYEDDDDRRVTPFTLFLARPGVPNPFDFYVDYAVLLSEGLNRRRKTAVFLGVCETLKDSLDVLRARPADPLGVAPCVGRLLEGTTGLDQIAPRIQSMPHVDFDAIIFLLEDTLFGLFGLR